MTSAAFDRALSRLRQTHDLFGPRIFPGGGRFSDSDVTGYGEIACLSDLHLADQTYFSPKEILFPIRETLFHFREKTVSTPESGIRPTVVFARPCDINGIHRLDTIFLENGEQPDLYYARRRERMRFFLIECREEFENCFCVSMNANKTADYACALRFDDGHVNVEIKDREFEEMFAAGEAIEPFLEFVGNNRIKVAIPSLASSDLEAVFEHELWREYTARCIACGRCNTSCVTCSCFTMQDVLYDRDGSLGERRRVWTGCHIDGFTDMAGGHAFRRRHGDRMRFKTMHKISDFQRRFGGHHMCVGCGRCDDVCPVYISFSTCINRLESITRELDNE